MTSNFTAPGEPIITETVQEALKSFIPEVFMSRLIMGTIKVLLYHLQNEPDRENYIDDYLQDVERLLEFLDVLRDVEDENRQAVEKGKNQFIEDLKQNNAAYQEQISTLSEAYRDIVEQHTNLTAMFVDLSRLKNK